MPDLVESVIAVDIAAYFELKALAMAAMHHQATITDLVTKNIDKIKNPRAGSDGGGRSSYNSMY